MNLVCWDKWLSVMGTKAAKTVEEQDCPSEDYQDEDWPSGKDWRIKWICCLAIIEESWIDFCWGHFVNAPGLFHKVWGLIHSGASCGILLASYRALAGTLGFCTKVRDLVERFGGRDTSWTWGLQDTVDRAVGRFLYPKLGFSSRGGVQVTSYSSFGTLVYLLLLVHYLCLCFV